MSRYAYEVEINGMVFEVESDRELTDAEAEAYARQQGTSQPSVRPRGSLNTERAQLVARARETGAMNPRDLFVEANTPGETLAASLDYGAEAPVYGLRQVNDYLQPGKDTAEIDAIMDERRRYRPDNEAGILAGNIATLGGIGGAGAKVGASLAGRFLPRWLTPAAEGAAAGFAEGVAMPVDDFSDKGAQIGLSTALGAVADAGVSAAINAPTNARNLPTRAYNANVDLLDRQLANSRRSGEFARRGEDLNQQYMGGTMTPGQVSGGRGRQFVEQRARESFWSGENVAKADTERALKFGEAVQRIAGDKTTPDVGNRVQGAVIDFTRDLVKNRRQIANTQFGRIDEYMGNRAIIPTDNLRAALREIVDEVDSFRVASAGVDERKAAAYARRVLKNMENKGQTISAKEAAKLLEDFSPNSAPSITGSGGKYENIIKRRFRDAFDADLDAAASGDAGIVQVPLEVTNMLREARDTWRQYSQNIRQVEKSALGKMIGNDLTGEIIDAANTKNARDVMNVIKRLDDIDSKYVAEFFRRNYPDLMPDIRGAWLNDALVSSMEGAPSMGVQDAPNPVTFLNELGLKRAERGWLGRERLKSFWGDQWGQMEDIIEIAERLADSTGRNYSGTASARDFSELMRRAMDMIKSPLRTGAGMIAEGATMGSIADSMKGLPFERRPLIQPPRVTTPARRAAAIGAPALFADDEY